MSQVSMCEEYVRAVSQLFGDSCPTAYQVLADNGREFPHTKPPAHWQRGPMGLCYYNSLLVAQARPEEFTYCEGYAAPPGLIPLEHAWVVDSTGTIIDPTWGDRPGAQYFGVPFDLLWVMDFFSTVKFYGVFPNLYRYKSGDVVPHLLSGIVPQSIAKEF